MGKWGNYAAPKGGGGGGLFVQFDDGVAVEVMVPPTAKPYQRYRKWNQATSKYEDASGPGKDIQPRILLPVFVIAAESVKILEMPPSTWSDFANRLDHEKVGGTDQIYEVSKSGKGKDTRWSVTRLDRAEPARIAQVARAELPDMDGFGTPVPMAGEPSKPAAQPAQAAPAPTSSASNVPLDDDIPF
jgi:hypothetical protein